MMGKNAHTHMYVHCHPRTLSKTHVMFLRHNLCFERSFLKCVSENFFIKTCDGYNVWFFSARLSRLPLQWLDYLPTTFIWHPV